MNEQIQAVFRRRKMTYTLLILVVLGIYFFSSTITKFHFTEGLLSFPKAFVWIGENLIPDELAIRRFPKILDKLIETVLLSCSHFCFFCQPVWLKSNGFSTSCQSTGANDCCIFPKCSGCCVGNAADVLLWTEHPDRILCPVLHNIWHVDPCIY